MQVCEVYKLIFQGGSDDILVKNSLMTSPKSFVQMQFHFVHHSIPTFFVIAFFADILKKNISLLTKSVKFVKTFP